MHTDSSHADFYVAVASVMPILLLALLWDSGFLRRLRTEQRTLRRPGTRVPGDVLFWTKGRVRVYAMFITASVLCAIGAAALVLADILPDTTGTRITETIVLLLELLTLFTRIAVDLAAATRGDESGSSNSAIAAASAGSAALPTQSAAPPQPAG